MSWSSGQGRRASSNWQRRRVGGGRWASALTRLARLGALCCGPPPRPGSCQALQAGGMLQENSQPRRQPSWAASCYCILLVSRLERRRESRSTARSVQQRVMVLSEAGFRLGCSLTVDSNADSIRMRGAAAIGAPTRSGAQHTKQPRRLRQIVVAPRSSCPSSDLKWRCIT